MNTIRRILAINPVDLAVPLAVFAATVAVGYLIRRLFLRAMHAWTARSRNRVSTIMTEALSGPSLIWLFILAAHLALESSDLSAAVTYHTSRILLSAWILSLTIMAMRIAGEVVRYYGGQVPGALPVTTLTQNLAQLGVFILGLMLILSEMGAQITPILTALGVGGLAVALALQDTLSNLFAGFYVAIAGQVRLGDYIKLNTGEEGYVSDIGWRSTSIRALANNLIIVPNAKLAQANVTNFHLPEKRLGVAVQVGVAYDSDPDRVEQVLLEIARTGAQEIPGLLAEPGPSVALDPGFGDWSLGYTLNFQVAEFADQFAVRHELRRRILRRFRQEGIVIPFPSRAVYLSGPVAGADEASFGPARASDKKN